jgi:tRNA A-37 threonylcarbamoyl transferase component Bud32
MNQEMIGKTIAGRYHILEVIGLGGAGTVYKALDARLQKVVALKMLSHHFTHDAEFKRRFQQEALVMAPLNHPNIVQVYDYGEADGLSYLVMEYIEGTSLEHFLSERKPLAVDYAIEIIRQVGKALSYAHRQGIIHRDLKPSNILISRDGRILLSDLGLAIAPGGRTITDIGTIVGTPAYMSPEQAMGKPVDARSDIYSLGLILYQLLTGRLPFSTDSPGSMLYAHVHESPPPLRWFNPAVPPLVEQAVLKALAKDPKQRYQTVDEFVAVLSLSVRAMVPAPALTEKYSPSPPPYAAARPSYMVGCAWQLILVGFLGTVALVAVFGPTLGNWVQSQPLLTLLATLAAVIVVSVALIVRRVSYRVRAEVLAAPPPSPAVAPPIPAQPRRVESQPTGETIPYAEPPVAGTFLLQREPSAMAWLLVLNGPHRGRHFPLADSVAIGREVGCDVVLDDPTASRQHARMRLENSRFYIYDLASSNGTFVNGVKVMKQELRDRDEIRIGNTIMLFVQAVSPEDLTVEAKRRLREFDSTWDQLAGPRAMDQGQFEALTEPKFRTLRIG